MNILKSTLLLFSICFIFSSCQKCETCTVVVKDYLWDDGLTQAQIDDQNATYELLGFANAQAYYDDLFSTAYGAGVEYCGSELKDINDEDDITVPGSYTVGWECVKE